MTSERLSRVCEWLLYRVNHLCNWAKAALLCAAQAQWRRPGPAGLEADQRHRRDYAAHDAPARSKRTLAQPNCEETGKDVGC